MRIEELRSEYQPTVGARSKHFRENADAMRGDPVKVAQAILRVVSEKEPPVRLLLGSDAVFLAGVNAAARAEEALQPFRNRPDQHLAPVLRAPHDVVRAGVDDVAVRRVAFEMHACKVYST